MEQSKSDLIKGVLGLKTKLSKSSTEHKLEVVKEIKQAHYSVLEQVSKAEKGTVLYEGALVSLQAYDESALHNLKEGLPLLRALDKECFSDTEFSYTEFMLTYTSDTISVMLKTFESEITEEKKIQLNNSLKTLNKLKENK